MSPAPAAAAGSTRSAAGRSEARHARRPGEGRGKADAGYRLMQSKIFFKPFVGDRYEDGFGSTGRKLLVLGESHYIGKDDDPRQYLDREAMESFTDGVVRRFWIDQSGGAYLARDFFGRLHRVLTGSDDPARDQVEKAWGQILYSNYVQMFAGGGATSLRGEGASAAKTSEHWKSGHAALPEIMHLYRPDRVLVLGKTNWNHIHYGKWLKKEWKSRDGVERGLWCIPTGHDEEQALATWVMHPSRGRENVQVMREVLSDLLSYPHPISS
jgi:hypothetical protein